MQVLLYLFEKIDAPKVHLDATFGHLDATSGHLDATFGHLDGFGGVQKIKTINLQTIKKILLLSKRLNLNMYVFIIKRWRRRWGLQPPYMLVAAGTCRALATLRLLKHSRLLPAALTPLFGNEKSTVRQFGKEIASGVPPIKIEILRV